MKKLWHTVTLAIFVLPVCATDYVQNVKITNLLHYQTFGDGDVLFGIDNPTENCNNFWLKPSDPGYKTSLSLVASAFFAKKTINVAGYTSTSDLWQGGIPKTCRMNWIKIHP